MNRSGSGFRFGSSLRLLFAAGLVLLAAADARAVRRTEDPLALVPADAATVAVMKWSELRQTPLGARVFRDLDHISGDDDAARFLEETGLTPREDIDTIIVAMTPGTKGSQDSGMVIFEGRFDPARIAKALESRKANLRSSPAGEYWLLKERGDEPGAVAIVNRGLIVCGNEATRGRDARAEGIRRRRRPDVRSGDRQAPLADRPRRLGLGPRRRDAIPGRPPSRIRAKGPRPAPCSPR